MPKRHIEIGNMTGRGNLDVVCGFTIVWVLDQDIVLDSYRSVIATRQRMWSSVVMTVRITIQGFVP